MYLLCMWKLVCENLEQERGLRHPRFHRRSACFEEIFEQFKKMHRVVVILYIMCTGCCVNKN